MNRGIQKPVPAGTQWEYRLTRLRFFQGQFVRRGIDVWPQGLKGDKLTELDVFGVSFDPQLRRRLEVIEGKTSSGRGGEIDRLIWVRGLSVLASAADVGIAKLKVDERTRQLARRLGVSVLDEQAVAAAESSLGIESDDWVGMHDPAFGETVIKPLREAIGKSNELNNAGKFLFGSYWFTDEFTRLKQLRTLFRLAQEAAGKIDDRLITLAVGEGSVLFAVAAYTVAAWHDQYSADDFGRFVTRELQSGVADEDNLRRLLRRIDEMHRQDVENLHRAYTEAGMARLIIPARHLESEILRPPEWTEGFLDLTARLRAQPQLASAVLRTLDLRLAHRLGSPRSPAKLEATWAGAANAVNQVADTIERFLTSLWLAPASAFNGNSKRRDREAPADEGTVARATTTAPLEPASAPAAADTYRPETSEARRDRKRTSSSEATPRQESWIPDGPPETNPSPVPAPESEERAAK